MEDDEMMSAGDRIRRLLAVRTAGGRSVTLTWEDQSVTTVDLSSHLSRFRVFAPLADDAIFETVVLEEWGWAIYWPTAPGAAIPSDLLDDMSKHQIKQE
jgi:hypothetical protein